MADEDNAGASYLASLRQPATSQALGSPPALAGPPPAENPTGAAAPAIRRPSAVADKRRSPRYECKGSARLQEIGTITSTWATFADISMHGCYVETATPLRLRATLGMKLDANGFRVEATGEVRVVYPGLGMGISFAAMPHEDRERLRELIRSLAPRSAIVTSRVAQRPSPILPADAPATVANPKAVLQAIQDFFKDRHVMGREEFLRILRQAL